VRIDQPQLIPLFGAPDDPGNDEVTSQWVEDFDDPTELIRDERAAVDDSPEEITRPSFEPGALPREAAAENAFSLPRLPQIASEAVSTHTANAVIASAAPPAPRVRGSVIPPPPANPVIGMVVDGRYRIESVLAEGGMGVVYDAVQVDLGRRVAIKALARTLSGDLDSVSRFRNEARALASLSHPHIVEVSDFGVLPDGAPYLVMERLRGETLGKRLRREGKLPIRESIRILGDMMSALAASHDHGILHRDLKPENVFLARREGLQPIVKLIDFGVAKQLAVDDAIAGPDLTMTGFVLGTPGYMAPEQARGERNLDARADLFAAGCIAYEMLTGRAPFTLERPNTIALAAYDRDPPRLRELRNEVSERCARLVEALIAVEREARYSSANDVLAVLTDREFLDRLVDDAATREEPAAERPKPPAPPTRTSKSRV
jgi:serine/threonine-protein kinase